MSSTKPAAGASSTRAIWSPEMIENLLQLRLGVLLPRFSRSRAPAHLQDAWNELHDEFAQATGVVVSVSQLKNKYQQLKREFDETQSRLALKREMVGASDSQGSQRGGGGAAEQQAGGDRSDDDDDDDDDDAADDPTLPPYWRQMKAAFEGAGGQGGVSFYNRPSKQINAIAASISGVGANGSSASGGDDSVVVKEADEAPTSRRAASSSTPAPSAETVRAAAADASPAMRDNSPAYPQIVIPRRLSVPSPQPPPRSANGSTSSRNSSTAPRIGDEERPRLSGVKRPLARDDPEESAVAATAQAAPALDVAQAIAAAGETIAKALLESARLIAGAPAAAAASSSASLSPQPPVAAAQLEAIAAKQSAHERMLTALAQSAKVSEALLQSLAESALGRKEQGRGSTSSNSNSSSRAGSA